MSLDHIIIGYFCGYSCAAILPPPPSGTYAVLIGVLIFLGFAIGLVAPVFLSAKKVFLLYTAVVALFAVLAALFVPFIGFATILLVFPVEALLVLMYFCSLIGVGVHKLVHATLNWLSEGH